MSNSLDEIIDEPHLEASCYALHKINSDPIQYYYKLKHPEVYSLPLNSVFNLLEHEQIYSELKNSVKSYISHVRQSYSSNRVLASVQNNNQTGEQKVIPIYDNKGNTNTCTIKTNRACGKPPDLFKIPTPSIDFSVYDSVHSIKVPLNTYKNKSRKFSQRPMKTASESSSSVAEVTQQMSGLVFERVEKAIPFPSRYKNIHSASLPKRKEKGLTVSVYPKNQGETSKK